MSLVDTFASRDPEAFVGALAAHCDVPAARLARTVRGALALHQARHLALEFLSELSLRAAVLRGVCADVSEAEYAVLHDKMCGINEQTQRRLACELQSVGLPPFFWEDVVLKRLTR